MKEILNILGRVGVTLTNHMSVMDASMVEQVKTFMRKIKESNHQSGGERRTQGI